jgi:MOSC domain-containing protein YiiM
MSTKPLQITTIITIAVDSFRKGAVILEMPYGMFGENFTIEGLIENEVTIGDTFQIGSSSKEGEQIRRVKKQVRNKNGSAKNSLVETISLEDKEEV